MGMPNPKILSDIDILDLIWQKDPQAYTAVFNGTRLPKRKVLIELYRQLYI